MRKSATVGTAKFSRFEQRAHLLNMASSQTYAAERHNEEAARAQRHVGIECSECFLGYLESFLRMTATRSLITEEDMAISMISRRDDSMT